MLPKRSSSRWKCQELRIPDNQTHLWNYFKPLSVLKLKKNQIYQNDFIKYRNNTLNELNNSKSCYLLKFITIWIRVSFVHQYLLLQWSYFMQINNDYQHAKSTWLQVYYLPFKSNINITHQNAFIFRYFLLICVGKWPI